MILALRQHNNNKLFAVRGELLHLSKNTMVQIHFSLSPDLRHSYMFYNVQNICLYVLTVTINISGWYGNFHNIARFLFLYYLRGQSPVATEPIRHANV